MAKLVLNINGIEDDFFTGCRLLGIMSQLKNYRFCWLINARLNYDFRLNTDVEIQLKRKGRIYFFQVYRFYDAERETENLLYYNQFEGEYLLPELRHFDFLWLVKSDIIAEEDFITLQQEVRSIDGVQLVAELTKEKIKNKGNLIL